MNSHHHSLTYYRHQFSKQIILRVATFILGQLNFNLNHHQTRHQSSFQSSRSNDSIGH